MFYLPASQTPGVKISSSGTIVQREIAHAFGCESPVDRSSTITCEGPPGSAILVIDPPDRCPPYGPPWVA